MKLILALLLIPMSALALLDVDRQELYFRNFLTNPGFEYGIQGVTTSSATPAIESTNYATGKRALKCTASATNGYCETRTASINIKVSRLQYSFFYKTANSSTVKVDLYDSNNNFITSSGLLPAATTYFEKVDVKFTGTPGSAYKARIVDTTTPFTTGIPFYLDDLYIGEEVANAAANVPQFESGMIMPYVRSSCPDGWLSADGSAVSRSEYAALFGHISTTYGSGDGSTTFNLPDYRGVFFRGAGTNGTYSTFAGGSVGTYSADSVKNHQHPFSSSSGSAASNGDHYHGYSVTFEAVPGAYLPGATAGLWLLGSGGVNVGNSNTSAGTHSHNVSVSGTTDNQTGGSSTETKPASYSVLYCVKY